MRADQVDIVWQILLLIINELCFAKQHCCCAQISIMLCETSITCETTWQKKSPVLLRGTELNLLTLNHIIFYINHEVVENYL
jgi:hypothetical protein